MVSKWVINLLINGVYWGCNSLTNHFLSSWCIQAGDSIRDLFHSLVGGHKLHLWKGHVDLTIPKKRSPAELPGPQSHRFYIGGLETSTL